VVHRSKCRLNRSGARPVGKLPVGQPTYKSSQFAATVGPSNLAQRNRRRLPYVPSSI
jgi:hypothetical protein